MVWIYLSSFVIGWKCPIHLHILAFKIREYVISHDKRTLRICLNFIPAYLSGPSTFTNIHRCERQRMRISAKETEVVQRRSPGLRKALGIQRQKQEDAPFALFTAPRRPGPAGALGWHNETGFGLVGFLWSKDCVLFQATNYRVACYNRKPTLSFPLCPHHSIWSSLLPTFFQSLSCTSSSLGCAYFPSTLYTALSLSCLLTAQI